MFFKMHELMFFSFTMVGTIMAISSNSWFTAWLGLEINLLSVTPLILNNLNPSLTEASIKYFLTQALASLFLIFSSMNLFNMSNFFSNETNTILLTISLLIKAGMVPFHFWFPQVMKLINWKQAMIMLTWQKIAPLMMISFLENKLLITISMISSLTGAIMGLNQNNIKLLLTFSSISHSGWMVFSSVISFSVLLIYMTIYFTITISLILLLDELKVSKIKQMFFLSSNKFIFTIFSLNLMSLGGMPPLLGFMAKLPALMILVVNQMFLALSVLIFSSLISLFFYTRIIYNTLMFKSKQNFITQKTNINLNKLLLFSIISNFLVPFLI